MSPEQLSKLQRDYLILTEKRSAYSLAAEFEVLKREIADYLIENAADKKFPSNFLDEFLDILSENLDILSTRSSSIVRRAQQRVIHFAGDSLKKLFPELSSNVFEPDKPALEKLIGQTQTGESLKKLFASMRPQIAEKTEQTLIEGFSLGESNSQIAKRISDVSDIGYSRALTISRTETNEAYRAASREFYQSADIRQYVWVAVLDVRTCIICWHLHGRKFKSAQKVFSHPNCRCTLIPMTKNMKPIKAGAELFGELESGYQKQILGAKRFELFTSGNYKLNDFVGSKESGKYGKTHFINNLSELEMRMAEKGWIVRKLAKIKRKN